MLVPVAAVAVLLQLGCFCLSMANVGVARATICHFWYFTLIWVMAFPVRAVLIAYDFVDTQVAVERDPDMLAAALSLSLVFWVVTYLGFMSVSHRTPIVAADVQSTGGEKRSAFVLILTIVLAVLFLDQTVFVEGQYRAFEAKAQLEARIAGGAFFLMAELFWFVAVAYIAQTLDHSRGRLRLLRWLLYSVVVALSLVVTVAIYSRRVFGLVVFAMAVAYSLGKARRWIMCWLAVMGSVALAPVLEVVRYIDVQGLLDGSVRARELLGVVTQRFFLNALSSTFEGVDHVLAFLRCASLGQLAVGVDGGTAWLYNAGLALVPRAIWPGKPLVYGSVAEQLFLYPEMFVEGPATTTIPLSFVVDFVYGCGILLGLLLTFLMGRTFAVLWQDLWGTDAPVAARAISLFIFINIFNVVRGGTGIVQSVVLFVAVGACSLGVRETRRALASSARRIIGRRFGVLAAQKT